MAKKKKKSVSHKLQPWIEARRRHRLSHAQVQMARELGMNPGKLAKLDNHDQEPWKLPLPHFIEKIYRKQFGRERPELVRSVEQIDRQRKEKKERRRELKATRRQVEEVARNDRETEPTDDNHLLERVNDASRKT